MDPFIPSDKLIHVHNFIHTEQFLTTRMTATQNLVNFWSTLITEKGLTPHVESLMGISDFEERGFSLLSRVIFLWCMGMKYEKEVVEDLVQTISGILKRDSGNPSCIKCSDIKLLIENTSNNSQERSENGNKLCSSPLKPSNWKIKQEPPSPEKVGKNYKSNKENIETPPKQVKFEDILAPETEYFSHTFTSGECGTVIIPETIPIEQDHYGNTDFFENCEELESKMNPSKLGKEKVSPILGKQSKANVTPLPLKARKALSLRDSPVSSCKSKEKSMERPVSESSLSPPKETKENLVQFVKSPESTCNSPSLLGCERLKFSQSLVKQDTVNNAPPEENRNSDYCPFKEKVYNLEKQESFESNSKASHTSILTPNLTEFQAPSFMKNQTLSTFQNLENHKQSSSEKSFTKAKSELGVTLSKYTRLSRLKTLNALKGSKLDMEVEIDTSVKPPKKYRQTKITKSFLKKTDVAKLTGGVIATRNEKKDDHKEEESLSKVVEESIHTKEVEDLLRKKRKQLEEESPTKINKVTPSKRKREEIKSEIRLLTEAGSKSLREKEEEPVQSTSGKASQLTEEEVLAQLEENQEKIDGKRKRSRKKPSFENSFDVLPTKGKEPKFAYRGDVVRKKSERKQLEGWDCHECRDYYNARGLTDLERKDMKNKCSRHRSKHRPVTNTPEGFWVVGWDDD